MPTKSIILVLLTLISGCSGGGGHDGRPVETDSAIADVGQTFRLADDDGLSFIHQVSGDDPYFMPRLVGSGVAIFDFDGDGLLDVYLLQNAGPETGVKHQLFRHVVNGKFEDVSAGSGLDVDGYGMGVAAGDVNNDGRVDILITEYGAARLFLNQSSDATPRFVDITEDANVDNPFWGTSTCFVDYNRDGWLDIILVNYLNYDPSRWCASKSSSQEFCGPDGFHGRVTRLLKNLGQQDGSVAFQDVTLDAGLADHPGPGLGVYCADFDADRWPDIFIANDGKRNHLFMNQRDGTFHEEATLRGIGYNSMGKSEADMGVALGDVNGDGKFDVFVTHLTVETHTLWLQQTPGVFLDQTAASGITKAAWRGTGFGTAMADLDNDGGLDLVVANGRVTRAAGEPLPTWVGLDPFWHPYCERDQILLNAGNGQFRDVSAQNNAMCGMAGVSRGLACADFDDDGGLDLIVTQIAGPVTLLRNVLPTRGHWITVRALDPALKRDAYGAEVYVNDGSRRLMRWINPGYSFLCSNDPRAHFGLGDSDTITNIEVVWPDGLQETFAETAVDRVVVLRRGEGQRR